MNFQIQVCTDKYTRINNFSPRCNSIITVISTSSTSRNSSQPSFLSFFPFPFGFYFRRTLFHSSRPVIYSIEARPICRLRRGNESSRCYTSRETRRLILNFNLGVSTPPPTGSLNHDQRSESRCSRKQLALSRELVDN